jgi:large subunit ribosomal protein L31e
MAQTTPPQQQEKPTSPASAKPTSQQKEVAPTTADQDSKITTSSLSPKPVASQTKAKPLPQKPSPQPRPTTTQPKPIPQKTSQPKPSTQEKEYIVPLRKAFLKVPKYRRTGRAIKELKEFIAKHMKVPDRDTTKVKLDTYLNQEVHFKGRSNPPHKIKVKAQKSEDLIKVQLAETPQHIKFLKIRQSKLHVKPEKKAPPAPQMPASADPTQAPIAQAPATPQPEKTAEQKKDEKEKEQSVAQQRAKQAQQQAKAEKHIAKGAGPQVQRKALKK